MILLPVAAACFAVVLPVLVDEGSGARGRDNRGQAEA